MEEKRNNQIFKCESPENTIKRVSEAMTKLGLELEYMESEPSIEYGLHSAHLVVKGLGFFSNGKGTSPIAAKASAYAELAERISSRLNFKYFGYDKEYKIINDDFLTKFIQMEYKEGYEFNHQDNIKNPLKIESLLKKWTESKEIDIEKIKDSKISKNWVSAKSLSTENEIKVPLLFIRRISGTNGLCAGNVMEEAITQGSSEVFERYALLEVIRKKETVPTIKHSSIKNQKIKDIINFFEKNSIKVIIKDFTLEDKVPCLAVLLINENIKDTKNPIKKGLRYRTICAGASLYREEALIRCFTEHLQGYNKFENFKDSDFLDNIWEMWFKPSKIDYENSDDYTYLFINRMYDGDLSFLEKGEEINFNEIIKEIPHDLNHEIEIIKQKCKDLDTELIVVNHTHPIINFPVARIIMPGISDIMGFYPQYANTEILTMFEKEYEYKEFAFNDIWLSSDEEIKKLISKMEKHLSKYPHHIAIKTRGIYHKEINLFKILAFLHLKIGDLASFKIYMDILKKINPDNNKLYSDLALLAQNGEKKLIVNIFKKTKGCSRYMINEPCNNPFTSWCDQTCENKCAESYLKKLKKLMESFFE